MSSQNQVISRFQELYGQAPDYVVRAPGRINLIGEHTDYNQGLVLPAAIDKALFFAVKRNDSNHCNITALNLEESERVSLPVSGFSGASWSNYFQSIIMYLQEKGDRIGGLDCVFGGDIPIGAGLSSSSALDCGFIKSLNLLFDLGLDDWGIVDTSNLSNNQ